MFNNYKRHALWFNVLKGTTVEVETQKALKMINNVSTGKYHQLMNFMICFNKNRLVGKIKIR